MCRDGLTLPVAPQHASLASSMTTSGRWPNEFVLAPPSPFRICRAMLEPDIPLPIITTSAVAGNSLVDRWPRSSGDGSVCQKESVDFGVGRDAGCPSLGMSGIVRAMVGNTFEVNGEVETQ